MLSPSGRSAVIILILAFIGMLPSGIAGEQTKKEAPSGFSLPPQGIPQTWLQGTPIAQWEKDKVYLFEFWATWCGPCIAAMPHMEKLHQGIKDNPKIQITGVNVMDKKTPDELKAFLKKQSTPPTYAMAVDNRDGDTVKKWLEPLLVSGIPHALAVKNGGVIWQGHPRQLNGDMLNAMTSADYSSANAPNGKPASSENDNERFKTACEAITGLLASGHISQATALVDSIIGNGNLSPGKVMYLKKLPFQILLQQGKYKEAQASLDKLSQEYPNDYFMQMEIALYVMNMNLIPVHEENVLLAEQCLQRAIEISKKDQKEASLPWGILATLKERHGMSQEARECLLKALDLSSIGKAWTQLQKQAKTNEPFRDALNLAIAQLEPIKERSPQKIESVTEDGKWTPLFKKLHWYHHSPLTGLPANGTVFVNFWRANPSRATVTGNPAPSAMLDAILKNAGMLDHPTIKVISLALNPIPLSTADSYMANPAMKSPYPVGIPSDDSVAVLFDSFAIDAHPAVVVMRDGVVLWSGETARLPSWVLQAAAKDTWNKDELHREIEQQQNLLNEKKKAIIEFYEKRKAKDGTFPGQLAEANAARFPNDGSFASILAEHQAGEAYKEKKYKEAVDILETVMQKFPKDYNMASYLMRPLSSLDELKPFRYKALRRALQIMADANIRNDGGYNAACHEYMMKLAMDHNDYEQARKDAILALIRLPLVRQYSELVSKKPSPTE